MAGIYSLEGSVQHYEWGGHQYIPALVNQLADDQPWAELWLGAHSKSPALINGTSLSVMIHNGMEAMLGKAVADKFAGLPFLMKVLDVEKMLSIQVHPTLAQAQEGFAREEQAGIAIDATERNYRDANHKPELMVALSDFWLLHGFRSTASAVACLRERPEFSELANRLEAQGMDEFYREVMLSPDDQLLSSMTALAARLELKPKKNRNSPDYWFLKAVRNSGSQLEPGMLSLYLLNLVYLHEGEGIFQDAGIPHAYLYGQNIEIMASSDNVLRAGLTPKHIDVPELLKVIRTEAVEPAILNGTLLSGESTGESVYYPAPVDDFYLEKIAVESASTLNREARSQPLVLLVMQGVITINDDLTIGRGESAFIAADTPLVLDIASDTQLFVASCGQG